MKFKSLFALLVLTATTAFSAKQFEYSLVPSNSSAIISFTNTFFNGVGTLEGKLDKRWVPLENFFIVDQRLGQVVLPLPEGYSEYRVRAVSIAPGNAFKNLGLVYNELSTVAGTGVIPPPGTNAWDPSFEGAPATEVTFSDPRAVVADTHGNIFISENAGHAILVISNGAVRTAVGTHVAGFIEDLVPIPVNEPPPFTPQLSSPSGLWLNGDRLYILDNGNRRVVRFETNHLRTVFYDTNGIPNGNGLWVAADESEIFYTDGKNLRRWRPDQGVEVISTNFIDLAAVTVNPEFDTIVADRGDNAVWQVNNDGVRQIEAGNRFPFTKPRVGKASAVSLRGPSSVWYMPFGGYLVGLDEGAAVWYVDAANNAARLVFGAPGVHDGDGDWFQRGRTRPKISNVKSVTVEPAGDILILEGGFVRRINFLRRLP